MVTNLTTFRKKRYHFRILIGHRTLERTDLEPEQAGHVQRPYHLVV